MAKQYLRGLSSVGYFAVTADEPDEYAAGTPRTVLEGAYSLSRQDNVNKINVPADDNPAWDVISDYAGTDITFVVRQMPLEALAFLLGAEVDANGSMAESTYDTRPSVALNFRAQMSNKNFRCFQYFACKLNDAQVNHQTMGDNQGPQDYTLTFTATARAKDNVMRLTHETAETSVSAALAAAEAWLAAVHEPDEDAA